MKAAKLFSLASVLVFFGFIPNSVQKAPEEAVSPCVTRNSVFQNGEELTYQVYYNLNPMWVSAGEVTFKVFEEEKQYHYQAIGKTYKQHDWYFKVRDRYESWVDKNTLLPSYSIRDVSEGNYQLVEKTSYDQRNRSTTVWRDRKKGKGEEKTQHKTVDCVHDILSVLYHLRNIDFEKTGIGSTAPFSIFIDKEEYPLKMKFVGKDANKKVHGMGRYRLRKFEPDVISGTIFEEGTRMTVWVSDDENKIPVLIESPVSVGTVKIVLKGYKGLRYPFTAKVD